MPILPQIKEKMPIGNNSSWMSEKSWSKSWHEHQLNVIVTFVHDIVKEMLCWCLHVENCNHPVSYVHRCTLNDVICAFPTVPEWRHQTGVGSGQIQRGDWSGMSPARPIFCGSEVRICASIPTASTPEFRLWAELRRYVCYFYCTVTFYAYSPSPSPSCQP